LRPDLLGPPEANWRVFRLLHLTRLPEYRHGPPTSQRGHSAAAFSDRAPGWRLVGAVRGHGGWHRAGARGAVVTHLARPPRPGSKEENPVPDPRKMGAQHGNRPGGHNHFPALTLHGIYPGWAEANTFRPSPALPVPGFAPSAVCLWRSEKRRAVQVQADRFRSRRKSGQRPLVSPLLINENGEFSGYERGAAPWWRSPIESNSPRLPTPFG
jgi:hypothetical protein